MFIRNVYLLCYTIHYVTKSDQKKSHVVRQKAVGIFFLLNKSLVNTFIECLY